MVDKRVVLTLAEAKELLMRNYQKTAPRLTDYTKEALAGRRKENRWYEGYLLGVCDTLDLALETLDMVKE